MKAYWEFTDMVAFFTSLPVGLFIGAGLFGLGIVVLIVSGIAACGKRKCSPKSSKINDDVAFENPGFNERKQRQTQENNDVTSGVKDIEVKEDKNYDYVLDDNDDTPDYENTREKFKKGGKVSNTTSAIYINETKLRKETVDENYDDVGKALDNDRDSDDGYEEVIEAQGDKRKPRLAETRADSVDSQKDYVNVTTLKREQK